MRKAVLLNSLQPITAIFTGKRGWVTLLFCIAVTTTIAQRSNNKPAISNRATLQDSLDLYTNARQVQDFYEKSGRYRKIAETRLKSDDPAKMHAGNDRKYEEVLKTINNDRLTPRGKRKIRPEEYRINIDKYRYRQRELSDYVLNTDAPMQLFDRRIAPQALVDYTSAENSGNLINSDDVDFRMYDPIAVKPYTMLTPEEKALRNTRYPPAVKPVELITVAPIPAAKPQPAPVKKIAKKIAEDKSGSEFIISGDVPDSLRFKRFKSRKEAEDFINKLPQGDE